MTTAGFPTLARAGRRPSQPEHGGELAEVVLGFDHGEEVLAAVGQFLHDLDAAALHLVGEVTGVTLTEEHLTGRELDPLGWTRLARRSVA